jgi:RecJ-like exonuclease
MASQCNRCVGTGKCPTCSGRGEVEASEPRSFRRTRRHRFDTPDPQPCGVWRYQASLPTARKSGPMTEGETVAKGESAPANPECADEEIWQCSAECWRPCDRCHKLVCEKHDYLVPVWPPENDACDPADMVCKDCVAALWCRGDISQGARVQYLY